ncbi:hypothetical protein H0X32_04115 [Patescibacteria group bacterium]|nr:hypothetical protein [Patescibacteria group bacterium]
MEEITLDDKTYVSSKRAAQITGYAKDYVGQLCREGRVEARLVGRNWYVLESSIREHRFGKESSKNQVPSVSEAIQKSSLSTWEKPNYMYEAFSAFPKLENQDKNQLPEIFSRSNISETPVGVAVASQSAVVTEMQTAWEDWFKREKTENLLQEGLLDSPEVMESREELREAQEPEFEPVSIQKVSEPLKIASQNITRDFVQNTKIIEEGEDEVVRLHRNYTPAVSVAMPSANPVYRAPTNPDREPFSYAPQRLVPQQRTRVVVTKKKPSLVLSALLLSLAGISIAVAVIGTGKLDVFLNQKKINYYPIQAVGEYLGGERVLNNASK